MAERIPPGQLKKWAEKKILPQLEKGFNSFIRFAATGLPNESPQYTGFYASSWKTSLTIPRPTETYQNLKKFGNAPKEPWYSIGAKLRRDGRGSARPHVVERHPIPTFRLTDTVYIANTAVYSEFSFWRPPTSKSRYGGILPFIATLPDKAPSFFKADPALSTGLTVGGIRQ
jgi:hypothetical protein